MSGSNRSVTARDITGSSIVTGDHNIVSTTTKQIALPRADQVDVRAEVNLLRRFGPTLGRPHVDSVASSKHANMKELRFEAACGIWRVAFAFDPHRQGILLVAGDKSGVSQGRFYKQLIAKADRRLTAHLERLKKTATKGG